MKNDFPVAETSFLRMFTIPAARNAHVAELVDA